MLYLPFNVYLDSKRVSILIDAVLSTLPMLYLPFNGDYIRRLLIKVCDINNAFFSTPTMYM